MTSPCSHAFQKLNPLCLPHFTQIYVLLIVQPVFLHTLFDQKLMSEDASASLYMLLHTPVVSVLRRFCELHSGWGSRTLKAIYVANAQILRLLYQDFPHVLCNFHFTYVELLPRVCLYLRNLILDASPPNSRLPYNPDTTVEEVSRTL